MKRQARAFFALDFGSATTSAALIGRVGTHWRLVAHVAAPASIPLDLQLCDLLDGHAEQGVPKVGSPHGRVRDAREAPRKQLGLVFSPPHG